MIDNKDKIINLARKLLALVERGSTEGERNNAKSMLDSLLAKNNLTLNEIEPTLKTQRIVTKVSTDTKQMFVNLVASIVGKDYKITKCRGAGYWAVMMDDFEWIDFQDKWEIYRKAIKKEVSKLKKQHKKELSILGNAFISKYKLYPY